MTEEERAYYEQLAENPLSNLSKEEYEELMRVINEENEDNCRWMGRFWV